jgi:hypothetical protein
LFDELLNQKFLTLSFGHTIPPEKDRKGKDYCKWHNSYRHNTNNCITFRNCVQDLIQKGMLQYAKGNKDVMGIDIDPFPIFPMADVNVITARLKKGKLASQIERKIQDEEDLMETEEKFYGKQNTEQYFCLRCSDEIRSGEEVIAEKEYSGTYAKGSIRFNTMGNKDLQIYVGPKLVYEGEDPGVFISSECIKWYGEDDGPFLFKGQPVIPDMPGKPDMNFLNSPMFTGGRGRGQYPRGRGMRGRGPYVRGIDPRRMIVPPNPNHNMWDTVKHPKFPIDREFVPINNTQKRRLQRKFSERERRDVQMMDIEPDLRPSQWPKLDANKAFSNRPISTVWKRESTVKKQSNASQQVQQNVPKQKAIEIQKPGGQTSKSSIAQRLGGQEPSSSEISALSIKEQKAELKKSIKKKIEEFNQVLLDDEDDDDLLSVSSSDLMKGDSMELLAGKGSEKSVDFGQALEQIQFGSIPPGNHPCNMILVLPKTFQAKPNQPFGLDGDVEDETEAIAKINEQGENLQHDSIKIEKDTKGKNVVVLKSPDDALVRHLRPLYVNLHANGQPLDRVLIDNGAIVNILPTKTLRLLKKTEADLMTTEVTVGNFAGGCSPAKGVIALQLQIGSRKMNTTFFVIDSSSNYNALLGRDWIHINGCIPSSLHQALIFLKQGQNKETSEMEIFWADKHPFKADTNNIEAGLYDRDLWPVRIEDSEVKSTGTSLTEGQFLKYIKEGLEDLSKDFVRPNIISRSRNSLSRSLNE